MSLRRIRDSAMPTGGRGLAIAGLVTGYLGLLAQLGTLAFIGFFIFAAAKGKSGSPFLPPPPPHVKFVPATPPAPAEVPPPPVVAPPADTGADPPAKDAADGP